MAVRGVGDREVQQHPHVWIVEAVERPPALPAHGDDPVGTQQLQGMRDGGLGMLGDLGQVAHALLPLEQREQEPQPRGISEKGEDVRDVSHGGVAGDPGAERVQGPTLDICTIAHVFSMAEMHGAVRAGTQDVLGPAYCAG